MPVFPLCEINDLYLYLFIGVAKALFEIQI